MGSDLDRHQFVACVLWMHGRSMLEIAAVVRWTPGQVRGFLHRQFKDKPRSHLTIQERQELLGQMKADRRDGGVLKDEHFQAIPRVDGPRSAAEKPAEPDAGTREGRRERRRRQQQERRRQHQQEQERQAREQGHATRRGIEAAALDYLQKRRLLRDPDTVKTMTEASEEVRRWEAGTRLRNYIEGARLSSLGAFDYERATMGSGSGPKLSLAAYKLHCMNSLAAIRQLIADTEFALLEGIIDRDEFVWERAPAESRARGELFEIIRYGLDAVAVHEDMMTRADFTARWKEELPFVDANYLKSRVDAEDLADAAAGYFSEARRA